MHKTQNSKCQWHNTGKLTGPTPGNMVDAMGMACPWQTDRAQAGQSDRYHGYGNQAWAGSGPALACQGSGLPSLNQAWPRLPLLSGMYPLLAALNTMGVLLAAGNDLSRKSIDAGD